MRSGRRQSWLTRVFPVAVALAALTSSTALGECSDQPDAPCVLPVISIPPALGVRVQGSVIAGTMGFSFGVYAGPHQSGATPPVLVLLDLGAAMITPSLVEPWLRLSASWIFSLGRVLALGPGLSAFWPDFKVGRLAGGLAGTVLLRFGGVALRLTGQVEFPITPFKPSLALNDGGGLERYQQPPSPPVFSLALGLSPR